MALTPFCHSREIEWVKSAPGTLQSCLEAGRPTSMESIETQRRAQQNKQVCRLPAHAGKTKKIGPRTMAIHVRNRLDVMLYHY